jgi:hypothetical protein
VTPGAARHPHDGAGCYSPPVNFPPKSNLWHAGLLPAGIDTLLEAPAVAALRDRVVWFPDPGPWRYVADPFGLHRDGALHVFVEAYDYRTKHAVIEHHEFGDDLVWRGASTCLAGPVHMSYPYVFEHDGEVFMVPETSKAHEVALYRATRFPDAWQRECALLDGIAGVDATPFRHEGTWWMFHAIAGPDARDRRELHVACADRLTGPWRAHPRSPVVRDIAGSRPGGTPFLDRDGVVVLPVQDCARTYGGAIRFLRFATLTPEDAVAEPIGDRITGDLISDVHVAGFHTLAGCGEVTLFDAKRIKRSFGRYGVDLGRLARRALRGRSGR